MDALPQKCEVNGLAVFHTPFLSLYASEALRSGLHQPLIHPEPAADPSPGDHRDELQKVIVGIDWVQEEVWREVCINAAIVLMVFTANLGTVVYQASCRFLEAEPEHS